MRIRKTTALLFVMFSALHAGAVRSAPDFPTKPVKIVMPYTAGGSNDVVVRILATALSERWKQPVIMENRPGAGGQTAYEAVARSASDGYTVGTVVSALTTLPYVTKNLRIDPRRDLVGISNLFNNVVVLAVNPSVPANTIKEFVAWTKANPGKVNYGSPGRGTYPQLIFEMVKVLGGANMTEIPFPGTVQVIQALLRNDVQIFLYGIGQTMPYQQSGAMRIIVTVDEKRAPELPNVQALKETGWFDIVPTAWVGWVAPAGTPKDVIDKISADVKVVMNIPEVAEKIKKTSGANIIASTPQEFDRLLGAEFKFWGEMTKRLGIEPE